MKRLIVTICVICMSFFAQAKSVQYNFKANVINVNYVEISTHSFYFIKGYE